MTKKRISILGLDDKYSPEATSKSAEQLEYEFIKTTAYNSTVSLESPFFVIVGEKGSGKSTILRRVIHSNPGQTINIQYKDFFDVINQRVASRHSTNPDAYKNYTYFQTEWAIELWVQIIKALYRQHKSHGTWIEAIVDIGDYLKLFEFLDKYNLLDEPVWSRRLLSPLRKIRFKWKQKSGDEIEVGAAKLSEAKLASLQQINENISKAVANILCKAKLYLFVDEIDDIGVWEETVIASLRGLLLASQSIVGVINQNFKKAKNETGAGLRIRIAMRDDMLEAAKDYVSGQKIIDKTIRSFWVTESLYDLLIQLVRSHWNLASNAISKDKLFVEIFPHLLPEYQKTTIEQFCIWSNRNPRALFTLMSKVINYSSERQQAYLHNLPDYEPLFITQDDISMTIYKFSEDMMKWYKQSYEFMFPGLERIISSVRQNMQNILRRGYVARNELKDFLELFFQDNPDVIDTTKKWTPQGFILEADKVIDRLCSTGFLDAVEIDGQSMFEIAPMFKIAMAGQIRHNLSSISDEKMQEWIDLLLAAIKNLIDSVLPPKETNIPGGEEPVKAFDQQSIRYNIVKCFWTLRYLKKMIIAYGDREEIKNKFKVYEILEIIRNAENDLSVMMETDFVQMDILSVLLNSPNNHYVSVEEFANHLDATKKIETGSDAEMYLLCAKGIKNWVQSISNPRKKDALTNELGTTLEKLKTELENNIKTQVAPLETKVQK